MCDYHEQYFFPHYWYKSRTNELSTTPCSQTSSWCPNLEFKRLQKVYVCCIKSVLVSLLLLFTHQFSVWTQLADVCLDLLNETYHQVAQRDMWRALNIKVINLFTWRKGSISIMLRGENRHHDRISLANLSSKNEKLPMSKTEAQAQENI